MSSPVYCCPWCGQCLWNADECGHTDEEKREIEALKIGVNRTSMEYDDAGSRLDTARERLIRGRDDR